MTAPASPPTLSDTEVRDRLRAEVAPGAGISRGLAAVEEVYRASGGAHARVPWAHAKANPALVAWLNARAPGIVRCGARVAVVGCGLGADAVELVERGYEVCAFDACASAIEHARALHPQHASIFKRCDLRDMPASMRHRYDLVVEIHTLQSLPPEHRATLASGIEPLLSARGRLLVIARGRADGEPLGSVEGPPYPFTPAELTGLLADLGLVPETPLDDYLDGQDPPARRLRGLFARA
ncbi:MAG: methyltransferase domain-containing protein [Planctomycetota bacterium]